MGSWLCICTYGTIPVLKKLSWPAGAKTWYHSARVMMVLAKKLIFYQHDSQSDTENGTCHHPHHTSASLDHWDLVETLFRVHGFIRGLLAIDNECSSKTIAVLG